MAGGSASGEPMTRDNDLTSSIHKVLSYDDLLIEILLRLPMLSLHLFKPVCKQWLSLITSLTLGTRIPTVDPPSGLFTGRVRTDWGPDKYEFVSFDPRIPSKRSILFTFKSNAHIRQSCNGLLLCNHHDGEYSINNPLSSMFKMLPPIHDLNYKLNGFKAINMAFDPTKSPYYKVVHVGDVEDDDDEFGYSLRIQTYSSETGVWSVWDDQFSGRNFNSFGSGMYWNGAIHWLSYFEPSFHLKLDIVDRPVLTNIKIPRPAPAIWDRKLFKSNGSLLLLCKDYGCSPHLNIYEMQTGSSEWSLKYFINLDDMMRSVPTLRMPDLWECHHILSIVLEEDPFMVIEWSGNFLQYKFLSETVTKLLSLGKGVS